MSKKGYDWEHGAPLLDHTARKLKVLQEYFAEYLRVRCGTLPQQSKFRLAVVDGFSGAGRYSKGEAGSPIVILQTLQDTLIEIAAKRAAEKFRALELECYLVLNDADPAATALLREHLAPILLNFRQALPSAKLHVEYESASFESFYPSVKARLEAGRFNNVLFNLDQCGDTHVDRSTLIDILSTFDSAEIFLTFMIKPLLAYLRSQDPEQLLKRFAHLDIRSADLKDLDGVMNRKDWLGAAEKLVYRHLSTAGTYASPFSIHNPEGWRYWLVHLANAPRARQVYNDVLHANSNTQAHFGRSGLEMLAYDPSKDGSLYLFGAEDRIRAKTQLLEDVPRAIEAFGDAVSVGDFYRQIYRQTAAHSQDIRASIFESPDVEILSETGGTRFKAHTIKPEDVLRLTNQRSMFSVLWPFENP